MRSVPLLAALLVAGLATAAQAVEVPVDRISIQAPRDRQIRIDFPVGELVVEATDGFRVTFDLSAKCKGQSERRCEERLDDTRIEQELFGGELRLKVKDHPKGVNVSLIGMLRVPRDVDLRVQMNVGALRIDDVEGDLDVDLSVGEADIRSPFGAVRSVDVSTGVGNAEVHARGAKVKPRGFVGSSASWDGGRGRSSITLEVGVGDATVRVD